MQIGPKTLLVILFIFVLALIGSMSALAADYQRYLALCGILSLSSIIAWMLWRHNRRLFGQSSPDTRPRRILGRVALAALSLLLLGFGSRLLLDRYKSDPVLSKTVLTRPEIETAQAFDPADQFDVGLPVRLRIPSLSLDAPLEQVGLTKDGAVDVPKNPADAAWFKLGPRPGERGSAIIDGHFDWKNGAAVVFDNLHKLKIGDRLIVEDERGSLITFAVQRLQTYDQHEAAAAVFSGNDNGVHLNLITCEGSWDKHTRSYTKRLVVFTDKVTE